MKFNKSSFNQIIMRSAYVLKMGKRTNLISLSLDDPRTNRKIPIPLSRFHFIQSNVFICFGTLVKLTLRWRQFMGVHVRRRLQLHAPPNMYHTLYFFQPSLSPVATAAMDTIKPKSKIPQQKCSMENKFGFFTDEIEIRLDRAHYRFVLFSDTFPFERAVTRSVRCN